MKKNIRPSVGHSGRHSAAYHQEVRRRMDEGYKRVAGQSPELAQSELDKVVQKIWEDIESGVLKPYDHKDVLLPPP